MDTNLQVFTVSHAKETQTFEDLENSQTVQKLLEENKTLKEENTRLQYALRELKLQSDLKSINCNSAGQEVIFIKQQAEKFQEEIQNL